MFSIDYNFYNYADHEQRADFFNKSIVFKLLPTANKRNYGATHVYDLAASFDIETSSLYINHETGEQVSNEVYSKELERFEKSRKKEHSFKYEDFEKFGTMYIWQFGLNGHCIYGRTWEEFNSFISELRQKMKLKKYELVVYVHNLAYEFQFIRRFFHWRKDSLIALESRKIIAMRTYENLYFKCSYMLSGLSLAKTLDGLQKYKIKKLVGDLDYDKIRNSKTPLTEKELSYCCYDVLGVMAYIQEKIESDGSIRAIPFTNTGYVRNYVREKCIGGPGRYNYMDLMSSMEINLETYERLHRAFSGGFTHASALKYGRVFKDVASYDFTSSYPAVMISEAFPYGKQMDINVENLTIEDFENYLDSYCCLIDVTFYDIDEKFSFDHYISKEKCYGGKNIVEDNGRVVSADEITMTITEIDFNIISNTYTFDMDINGLTLWEKRYLPRPIVESVCDFYQGKTTLKDVAGKEEEYLKNKGMLNSIYGMMVMAIVRDVISYEYEWQGHEPTQEEKQQQINKEMSNKRRFTAYAWGVWVTAYARANLWSGILECESDFIYSDTDSIKILNHTKHIDYINNYNYHITNKVNACLDFYGIDREKACPKTIKGESKPIGVWDYEGNYSQFKTLGAKRYMTSKGEEMGITIAGLGKKIGLRYIVEKHGGDVEKSFDYFRDGMSIPAENTGKLTHTYSDDVDSFEVIDYLGNKFEQCEKSFIHMEKVGFNLSISSKYRDFINGMNDMQNNKRTGEIYRTKNFD